MKRIFTIAILFLVLGFFTSCSREARIKLYNHTGSDVVIQVEGETYSIANGRIKTFIFPAKSKKLSIMINDTIWDYSVQYPPIDYCSPTAASIIHMQLEPDGQLYVFLPKTLFPVTDISSQPKGFPLIPKKTDK